MKSKEARELSVVEIEKKIRDARTELVTLRLRKQTGQVEKPHLLREIRRDLARFQTILKEKKTAEAATAS
ncbi:MAG: 50S ribosomal protein L29 [Verrucomicrobiota bacterium]